MDTEPPAPQSRGQRAWAAFRSWPRWAQITAWMVLVFAVLAAVGGESNGREVATRPASEADLAELPQVTTTTLQPTTTRRPTTTAVPTTTTLAPTTTAVPITTPAIVTAPPPAAPPAAEEEGCHSSYEGVCLPFASDVDCAGGSGNGPVYTSAENFSIVGPDEYGLDSDNDGLGCEP